MEKLEAAIEAILFSAGDSVETGRIAKAIGQDKTTTEKIIRNMMLKYNARDRGIKILELDGAFQLCTKQEYYEYLVEIALQPKKAVLTDVMLESLSIIAYKQPVTKQEIEKIRGVNVTMRSISWWNIIWFRNLDDWMPRDAPFFLGQRKNF